MVLAAEVEVEEVGVVVELRQGLEVVVDSWARGRREEVEVEEVVVEVKIVEVEVVEGRAEWKR